MAAALNVVVLNKLAPRHLEAIGGVAPDIKVTATDLEHAGEHIADWQGFMEGAIETGEAAADALIK